MAIKKMIATVAASCAIASPAVAQQASAEGSDVEAAPAGTVLAPKNAFEIGVDGGYTQSFGMLDGNTNMTDIAHAGGSVALNLAYRATPLFAIGGYGQFNGQSPDSALGDNAKVNGAAAGIMAAFHFLPYRRVDPYLTAGVGWRMLNVTPTTGDEHIYNGVEALKANIGADFRVDKSVALGPLVGADVNVFLQSHDQTNGGNVTISSKGVNTFIFAGLGGKFDLGGKRIAEPGHEEAIPAAAPPVAREAKPAEPPPAEEAPTSTGVTIDDELLAKCHLDHGRAFFEIDKANLGACDLTTINDIAACLSTGPLKGMKLDIIGHADPRGTDDYNMKLGESRAESVSLYLQKMGVPKENLTTSSKGKTEAIGVDESGWAYDRRVEIRLVKEPEGK